MMRIIPGKTKVQMELFKGITLADMLIGLIGVLVVVFLFISSLPYRWLFALIFGGITAVVLARLDSEPNYIYILNVLRHFGYPRRYDKLYEDKEIVAMVQEGEENFMMEEAFKKEEDESEPVESKAERKARLKREKAERKEDDKILKSKTATQEEKDAIWLKRANQSAENKKAKRASKSSKAAWFEMSDIMSFTGIHDDLIEYGGLYYGAAIEIPPIEFRFFSEFRRNNSIENALGAVLRNVNADYACNIVKIERPVSYRPYVDQEFAKLDMLRKSYENGMLKEDELQARVEVLYERINELNSIIDEDKVVLPFYYLVIFDSDKQQLNNTVNTALDTLRLGELEPKRLNTKELAIMLKYSNALDIDETDLDNLPEDKYAEWAMPKTVEVKPRQVLVNNVITHNFRVVNYPMFVGDAWIAGVMSQPNTKVVIKCQPMDRGKAIRTLDRSLQELRSKFNNTNVDSQLIEIQNHIDTLTSMLAQLSNDNELLLNVSVYVTAYDIVATRNDPKLKQPPVTSYVNINNLKKTVRRVYQEQSFRLNNMEFNQTNAFIGSQISAYDPMHKDGRGMPSNTLAACFPWIYAYISDEHGIKLGNADGVPVFIDFFRRDSERVNSNMVIVGKSGSGKSYATKSLLTNLAADDSKIFILDPENEYAELANNLHGKFINVGNAQFGRLNPFHIITALDDDESDGSSVSGSYATHLQFLEEFFKQIIPDCEKDAMEYLNSLIDRTYAKKGITAETDLSRLKPEDYPIFDDLYDNILFEFQNTDNEYIRTMLRTLMNYIAKFSTGGRNSNIWNGPSTITTEENFTVFNFQSLLANRNGAIANAQMLLVLKYVDNEIIKNRDYNTKYGLKRKVVVVIDEAHVFIDAKFPIALDFMFQLAKRIRKYNGMQLVITQNIKDFVGSEEIARKSTAIINACQYSFIFALAPNDMEDLCKLYEKAGGINENEQEQIVQAPRGQAFTIMGPQSRSTFKVKVPDDVVHMFEDQEYVSSYFTGEQGEQYWADYMGDSREKHDAFMAAKQQQKEEEERQEETRSHVSFLEISEEEMAQMEAEEAAAKAEKDAKLAMAAQPYMPRTYVELQTPAPAPAPAMPAMDFNLDDFEIPDIPEDPAAFAAAMEGSSSKEEPDLFESLGLTETVEAPQQSGAGAGAALAGAAVGAAAAVAAGGMSAVTAQTPIQPMAQPYAAPAPQVVVQAPPSSGKTEEMLATLLQRFSDFSYAAMMEEVKRTVREEMGNMPAAQAAPAAAPAPAPAPAVPAEEESDDLFGGLFGEISAPAESTAIGRIEPAHIEVPVGVPEEEPEFDFASLFEDTEESAEEEGSGFDIMQLLAMEAEKMDDVSPIDQMVSYGEMVIDISLEDLVKYNKAQAN